MENSCGSFMGYRQLTRRLRRKYDLKVRRDTVMRALSSIDPEGVERVVLPNLRSGSIFVSLWKLHSGGQGETKIEPDLRLGSTTRSTPSGSILLRAYRGMVVQISWGRRRMHMHGRSRAIIGPYYGSWVDECFQRPVWYWLQLRWLSCQGMPQVL